MLVLSKDWIITWKYDFIGGRKTTVPGRKPYEPDENQQNAHNTRPKSRPFTHLARPPSQPTLHLTYSIGRWWLSTYRYVTGWKGFDMAMNCSNHQGYLPLSSLLSGLMACIMKTYPISLSIKIPTGTWKERFMIRWRTPETKRNMQSQ